MVYDGLEVIKFGFKTFSVFFTSMYIFEISVCDCGKEALLKEKVEVVEVVDSDTAVCIDLHSRLGKVIIRYVKDRLEKATCPSCSLNDVTKAYCDSFTDGSST